MAVPDDEQQIRDQEELAAMVAWAKHRLGIGKFDSKIKELFVQHVGEITPDQIKQFNTQKTAVLFGVSPDAFVAQRRAYMPGEKRKNLHAPDMLDAEESALIHWAMESIAEYIEGLVYGEQQYAHVLARYRALLAAGAQTYTLANGHMPILAKAIDMVMTLDIAKKYTKEDA